MNDRLPLLLASAAIAGIILISFISEQISLGFTDMRTIDSKMLNEIVHVRGVVKESSKFSAGFKMLIDQDGFKISVVYFTGETKPPKGMCADVVGEVKTYESSLEIEANSVNLFMC